MEAREQTLSLSLLLGGMDVSLGIAFTRAQGYTVYSMRDLQHKVPELQTTTPHTDLP